MTTLRTSLGMVSALGLLFSVTATASAAEPIAGNWITATGATAAISKCGGSYCVTLKSGEHAGKRIGRLSGKGGSYKGKITDPTNDKTYSGRAQVSGASLKMTGCALKVFCKTQNWRRK